MRSYELLLFISTFFFVLREHNGFLLSSISGISILGLCVGSHLNKTLDITELCLRLAFGLQADQEVRCRTEAITLVSRADAQ